MDNSDFAKRRVNNRGEEVPTFKRANRNRPREMSSKYPVPLFRNVFEVKKQHNRDPRFDDLSGTFNSDNFEEDYAFIEDMRHKEKEQLENELVNVGNDYERKKEICANIQKMREQDRLKKLKRAHQEELQRKKEEACQVLKEGKKPYFVKKSDEKKQKLVEKFDNLKKSGKLEKYLEKKRRKMHSKDKKKFLK